MAYEDAIPFLVASDALAELSSPSPPFFCFPAEDQSSLFANLANSHQHPTSAIMASSVDKFSSSAGAGKRKPSEDGWTFPADSATLMKKQKKIKLGNSSSISRSKAAAAPKGYIHVRARRGEATDRHSLAERVRREKISERMRILQGLVPGCHNLTGKATVLDQIINYVLSLQTRVQVLSMKLSSLSPMVYDFDVEQLEALML